MPNFKDLPQIEMAFFVIWNNGPRGMYKILHGKDATRHKHNVTDQHPLLYLVTDEHCQSDRVEEVAVLIRWGFTRH